MKILCFAEIPAGLEMAWLEHLRAFDRKHTDCSFFATIESASMPLDDAIAMLRKSGMSIQQIFRRMDAADNDYERAAEDAQRVRNAKEGFDD